MCDGGSHKNRTIGGVVLILLLNIPLMANAEEGTATSGKKSSEIQQTNKENASLTFSDVMNWAQRFGNRVGDNISEAASKTASAIKNGASDNQQKPLSKDSP